MSNYMENQLLATMYQLEVLTELLLKSNLTTKEEIKNMMQDKLDETLLGEDEKSEILYMMKI